MKGRQESPKQRKQSGNPTDWDQRGATAALPPTNDEARDGVRSASATYPTSDVKLRDEAVAFPSRSDHNKADSGLDINQCACCLRRIIGGGHATRT